MTLEVGQTIDAPGGRYVIEQAWRQGGFGQTYRGRDEASGHSVLLKELHLERLENWKALELFQREARVLRALDHPAIPRWRDFFAWDGTNAISIESAEESDAAMVLVQDFVDGDSLYDAIQAGRRFRESEIVEALRTLLDVLHYLHELNPPVIHRDIQPGNIIFAPDGVKLVDFGAIQDELRTESELGSTSVGTFGFMPIEQTMGRARPCSDLYALGMTMVVALTHRAPSELPVDPDTSKVDVAKLEIAERRLAAALDAMVEPITGQRVQTAAEAQQLLEEGALARPKETLPAKAGRPMHDMVFAAATGGGILSAGIIYFLLFDSLSEEELVFASAFWFAPTAFGIVGLLIKDTAKRPIRAAFAFTVIALVALFFFFVAIFPAL